MEVNIQIIDKSTCRSWDRYVLGHPKAHLYHLAEWERTIFETYGNASYYLIAFEMRAKEKLNNEAEVLRTGKVVGVLPLVHIKHVLFGNKLTSIPYFDMGGVLADSEAVEKKLINQAIFLAIKLKVDSVALRHTHPLKWFDDYRSMTHKMCSYSTTHEKLRMLLDLPSSSDILMKSFKSKLRSQIKKAIKEKLYSKIGWLELLEDFYVVFLRNMRDLGSPVHSKQFIKNVIINFRQDTRIIVVYKGKIPVAASIIVGFKDTLENPWASSLREYSRLSPNMMLYWRMLEYACDNGYKIFDFGRSTEGEGTYRFKAQWGAKPQQLHWHNISLNGKHTISVNSEKSKFDIAIHYWRKLPVSVTEIIGPKIRKYISL